MEVKLIDEYPKLTFDPATLDKIMTISKYAEYDLYLLGTLFYLEDEVFCNNIEIAPQSTKYQTVELDKDAVCTLIDDSSDANQGLCMNLIIQCKQKKAPTIYSTDEKDIKKVMEYQGEVYYMVINKDGESTVNFYNYLGGYKIENMGYTVDTSGYCDLKKEDIDKMVAERVKKTGYSESSYWNRTTSYDCKKVEEKYEPSELAKKKPPLKSIV